jgi:putative SOS response-associated peptidase YedK
MCGRYMVISSPEAIRRLFGYPEQPNFPPRYNVAPTQPVPIVRIVEGQRQFALVRWGLIPPWVKDPRKFALLINARGESVNDRAAFRYAMRRRRCLVPADGFYAWKTKVDANAPIAQRLLQEAARPRTSVVSPWKICYARNTQTARGGTA